MKIPLIILLFSLLISCQDRTSDQYENFFSQTFDIIREQSIKKNELDWNVIKKTVLDSIPIFRHNYDVYNGINYTVYLIDDGHSIFTYLNQTTSIDKDVHSIPIPEVQSRIIDNDIGYLKLSGFIANDSLSKLYSLKIREALLKLDRTKELSGWIVDLRDNVGGLAPSMPLGISPLFEDSLVGYSVDNSGNYASQYCEGNTFKFDQVLLGSLEQDYSIVNINKKIAVLVNERTASSGEFVASALRFQKNTRIFGQKTKGKTSHLRLISFVSRAKLLLATQYMCDSRKQKLTVIIPDVECPSEKSLENAIEWIKNAI